MINYIIIDSGLIVAKITKDGDFVAEDYSGTYDTVTTDPSGLLNVGDTYSIDEWEFYNLTDAEKLARSVATLESLKTDKLSKVVITTTSGKSFYGDSMSQIDMLSALQSSTVLNQTTTEWKLSDGTKAIIDIPELNEALALSIQKCGAIKLATTEAELALIV